MDTALKRRPKVSVVMPVYNCENYISEAVKSILNQTYSNFEFIIIDDASTDQTLAKINAFSDPRIKIIAQKDNVGLTKNLNYGIRVANGEYIARMDGDDISLPNRFAQQISFMDANKKTIVCGTNYRIIGSEIPKNPPTSNEAIKVKMLSKNCIGHPTVFIRRSVLLENDLKYDESFKVAQDYDLWVRLFKYGEFYNIPETLLMYRNHPKQVSELYVKDKFYNYFSIRRKILNILDVNLTLEEEKILNQIIRRRIIDYKSFKTYETLKTKLIEANKAEIFENNGFKNYLNEMEYVLFKDYFLKRDLFYPQIIKQYLEVKNKFNFNLTTKDFFKLIVKSLMFFSK